MFAPFLTRTVRLSQLKSLLNTIITGSVLLCSDENFALSQMPTIGNCVPPNIRHLPTSTELLYLSRASLLRIMAFVSEAQKSRPSTIFMPIVLQ